ncbi:hypothetical protein J6590_077971 [Homalodisca vitripennis]|nr:hypothetical protein J6590_077971 [Homalodisca vitripennis]
MGEIYSRIARNKQLVDRKQLPIFRTDIKSATTPLSENNNCSVLRRGVETVLRFSARSLQLPVDGAASTRVEREGEKSAHRCDRERARHVTMKRPPSSPESIVETAKTVAFVRFSFVLAVRSNGRLITELATVSTKLQPVLVCSSVPWNRVSVRLRPRRNTGILLTPVHIISNTGNLPGNGRAEPGRRGRTGRSAQRPRIRPLVAKPDTKKRVSPVIRVISRFPRWVRPPIDESKGNTRRVSVKALGGRQECLRHSLLIDETAAT